MLKKRHLMAHLACTAVLTISSLSATPSMGEENPYENSPVPSLVHLAGKTYRGLLIDEVKRFDTANKKEIQQQDLTDQDLQNKAPFFWAMTQAMPVEVWRDLVFGACYHIATRRDKVEGMFFAVTVADPDLTSPLHIRLMGYMASLDLTHIELTHALGQSKNFFSQLARNECLIQKLSLEGTLTTNRSTGLLRGLAELRFLKSLNLSWNQFFITDFEEITKLTQLEELIWRTNPFTNHISHLTALHNLRVLDLQSSKTEVSLEKLSSFTALEELNLSKTSQPINGLKHLQHFHGLRSLNLANCGMIKDASGVLLPQSLEILNVNQCALAAQPRVLTHLTRLVDLEIAGNRLGDALLEIAPLSRLTRLVAGHNDAPRSLTFLEQFTNLQGLHLAGNTQISTDFLRSLTNLRALSLASALLSEVEEDLHPLKNLFFLDLAKNPIQHLRNLSCGNTLQILNIEGTGLQFLTELTGLSQLKKVTLSNNSWNDLDQTLGFFTGLTELNSENLNMGAHLLALTSLSRLQVLNLDNNVLRKGPGSYHVPQMTVLETLRALKKLSVQKTELFKSDPILEALSKRNVEIVRDHRIGSKKFS